jgi:predicted lipoprotein with Yx(FWY)xxD motif
MTLSITRSAKVVLATAAAALFLAACGGGEGKDSADTGAEETGAASGVVSVEAIDGTDVLVDSQGRALYSADVEAGGRILCTGSCTADWDPAIASGDQASADINADLGVLQRPDGTEQLTYEGLPLYTFTQEGPGQLTGDGFVDVFNGTEFEWQVATSDRGSGSSGSDAPSDSTGGLY